MRRHRPPEIDVVEQVGHDGMRFAAAAYAGQLDGADAQPVQIVAAVDVFFLEPPRSPFVTGAGAGSQTVSEPRASRRQSLRLVGLGFAHGPARLPTERKG